MNRRLTRVLGLAFLVSFQARRVHADPSSDASQHFQAGLAHATAGEFERAMEDFQTAYTKSPHYSVLFNIGQTYALMGKPVEAVAAFQRYLQEGGTAISPARRKVVESNISFYNQRLGELRIEVEPANATLEIDGQALAGNWQHEAIRLVAGKHGFVLNAPGFRTKALAVVVEPGQRTALAFKLDPAEAAPISMRRTAQLQIGCEVPAVDVFVDESRRARTPLTAPLVLDEGSHRVRFSRAGYEVDEHVVELHAEKLSSLLCQLRYAPASQRGDTAELNLELHTAGTVVQLDGAPFSGGALPAGEHRAEASKFGFVPWRRDLSLSPGTKTVLEVSLQPEPDFVAQYRANIQKRRNLSYVVGGSGVLFGAAAVLLWVVNGKQYDEWQSQKRALEARSPTDADFPIKLKSLQDQASTVERLNAATTGCAIASGALLAAGAALWLTAGDPERYGRFAARVSNAGPELAWKAAW